MLPLSETVLLTLASLVIGGIGPLSLFIIYIYSKPHLIALFLVSSLASLFGFIVTAVIWRISMNSMDIGYFAVFGSFIQECCRYYLINSIYRTVEIKYNKSYLTAVNRDGNDFFILTDLSSSVASGVGFGFMKTLLIFGNVITKCIQSDSYAKSLNLFEKSPNVPTLIGLSIISCFYFILDFILMPIAFHANKAQNKYLHFLIFFLRISATSFMFFNKIENGFFISLGGISFIIFLSFLLLVRLDPLTKNKIQKDENSTITVH